MLEVANKALAISSKTITADQAGDVVTAVVLGMSILPKVNAPSSSGAAAALSALGYDGTADPAAYDEELLHTLSRSSGRRLSGVRTGASVSVSGKSTKSIA